MLHKEVKYLKFVKSKRVQQAFKLRPWLWHPYESQLHDLNRQTSRSADSRYRSIASKYITHPGILDAMVDATTLRNFLRIVDDWDLIVTLADDSDVTHYTGFQDIVSMISDRIKTVSNNRLNK